MAVIHDVIPAFELFQPTSVDDALALQARHGAKAWVLAGGLDSFDWFKDRIKRPKVVMDLGGIAELRYIRETADGVEIGAIQPSILTHPEGKLQILCRTRQGKLAESWSNDQGKTWSPMALTSLPNPNSGTDAVTLIDRRVHDGCLSRTSRPGTKCGQPPVATAISDCSVHSALGRASLSTPRVMTASRSQMPNSSGR